MNDGVRAIDCLDVQELVFDLRDGEFDAATADAVRAHVADCARCRAAATFDRRLTDLLLVGASEPPVGLAAQVQGRMRRRRRRVAAVAYATAAAVLVAGVLSVWRPWVDSRVAIVESHHSPSSVSVDDMSAVATLFEPPPVDSLDVLTREQSGYVAILDRLGEE